MALADDDITCALINSLTRMVYNEAVNAWQETEAPRRKFDPNQPHVPAGHSDGGQWTDTGGGGGSVSAPLPRRKPIPSSRFDNWWDDGKPASNAPSNRRIWDAAQDISDSLDPIGTERRRMIEGLNREIDSLRESIEPRNIPATIATLAVSEAAASAKLLKTLVTLPPVAFFMRAPAKDEKFKRAMAAIEEFLGGPPEYTKFDRFERADISQLLNMTLIRGDLQVRFDIAKFGNKVGDRPHFQLQKRLLVKNSGRVTEKWVDIGDHWYNFADSTAFARKTWS